MILVGVIVNFAARKPVKRSSLTPRGQTGGLDWLPEEGQRVHSITTSNASASFEGAEEALRVCCPKCDSEQIATHKRGFSLGKAAAGLAAGLMMIPGGVLWGLHGRKKLEVYCVACGHRWMAGGN